MRLTLFLHPRRGSRHALSCLLRPATATIIYPSLCMHPCAATGPSLSGGSPRTSLSSPTIIPTSRAIRVIGFGATPPAASPSPFPQRSTPPSRPPSSAPPRSIGRPPAIGPNPPWIRAASSSDKTVAAHLIPASILVRQPWMCSVASDRPRMRALFPRSISRTPRVRAACALSRLRHHSIESGDLEI